MEMGRRDREIAQGLRHPDGSLIGGLDVLEYVQGFDDAEAGASPKGLTSTSYDLGRQLYWRRQEEAEQTARMLAQIEADSARRTQSVRQLLLEKGRPDLLAEFDAKMASITKSKPKEPPAELLSPRQ